MAETLELVYFPIRGRGEVLRWLFDYAGVPFQEQLISFADWPQHKPDMPFHCVPILRIKSGQETKTLSQTLAILRYLASKFGLNGKNAWDQALMEQYVEGFAGMYMEGFGKMAFAHFQNKPDEEKAETKKKFFSEAALPRLASYEAFLAQSASGWLVGPEASFADIYIGEWVDRIEAIEPGVLKDYPRLSSLRERLLAHPGLQQRASKNAAAGIANVF